MKKDARTVVYDDELRIEACHFEGIVQPFPNHFHEHYVIGFVEDGERTLSSRNGYEWHFGLWKRGKPVISYFCIDTELWTAV